MTERLSGNAHDLLTEVQEARFALNDALTIILSSLEELRRHPLEGVPLLALDRVAEGTRQVIEVKARLDRLSRTEVTAGLPTSEIVGELR